jgi:hypothetical protein
MSCAVINRPPIHTAEKIAGDIEFLGDLTLLVSTFGRFWTVYTLRGGTPYGVLIFNAENGRHISDAETLNNISKLDCAIVEYDLYVGIDNKEESISHKAPNPPNVVEVQIGDSWEDYRPARPQDFVGRERIQKEIIGFLGNIKDKKTGTRIFAITGNSGMGKSSLIAKVRQRTRNKFYKNRFLHICRRYPWRQNTVVYFCVSIKMCEIGSRARIWRTNRSSANRPKHTIIIADSY